MIKAEEIINEKKSKNLTDLEIEYFKANKNPEFKKFTDSINLNDKILMKYTSSLMQCFNEKENCKNCKGLENCKNEVNGCFYKPIIVDGNINFEHKTCKYKNKMLHDIEYVKNGYLFEVSKEVRNANLRNIYTDDKKRNELYRWINRFMIDYKSGKQCKGLYLSGNFGSGKSYLVSAMINELVKDGYKGALIYYPEFLRSLKASFGKDFDEQFNYVKKSDLLLIDDIGAENISAWSRDEILGPIIQYRMDEKLPTFFTSNLSIEELEVHLSESKDKIDKIKAKRIIERIKFITDDLKLISNNNRK